MQAIKFDLQKLFANCKKQHITERSPYIYEPSNLSFFSGRINGYEYICLKTKDRHYFILKEQIEHTYDFYIYPIFENHSPHLSFYKTSLVKKSRPSSVEPLFTSNEDNFNDEFIQTIKTCSEVSEKIKKKSKVM